MPSIPAPLSLEGVFFYCQDKPLPVPYTIPPYQEWVEVVASGRGRVRDGGTWHEIQPGDLIWQSPGDTTICSDRCEHPFQTLVAQFRVRRARGMGVRRFSRWPDIGEIKALAQEACPFQWDDTFDRTSLRDYLYGKLLFQVRLFERSLKMASYPAPLAVAVARIESDFARPLRLSELAGECGWTVMHLQAEFRKHLKIAPHQMLIQKRLRVAKEQMVSTAAPIKQIAVECGFANLTAFGHSFKKHTGLSPRQFRNSHWRS